MAYEADSHLDIYPNLPMLWLDKRYEKIIPDSVKNFALDRLNIYESFIRYLSDDNKNNLEEISKIAWSRCGLSAATERDALFFNILTSEIKNGYKNIFVVVGADHANLNIEGSFVNRLVVEKYNTHVFILNDASERLNEIKNI